jgi:hypothetical protein
MRLSLFHPGNFCFRPALREVIDNQGNTVGNQTISLTPQKVAPVMLSAASFNRVMMIWYPVGSVLLGRLASPLLDEDYPLLFAIPVVHHATQAR